MKTNKPELSEKALEARRKYLREYAKKWREKNPEKFAAIQKRHWEKLAKESEESEVK